MAVTLADTLARMRRSGLFYAHTREGKRVTTLWRKSERGMAPVTPAYLRAWIADHVVSNAPWELVTQVMSADLSGFTVVTDDTAGLV